MYFLAGGVHPGRDHVLRGEGAGGGPDSQKELEVKAQFEKFLRKAEDAGIGGGDA